MDNIYITAYQLDKVQFLVDVESLIIVNIYRIAGHDNIKLKIKLTDDEGKGGRVNMDMSRVSFEIIQNCPEVANYCAWPVIVQDNYVTAGLCSVARQIIKRSEHKKVKKLLGFRDACLMACSESSVWTKFCEVDMVSTVKSVLTDPSRCLDGDVLNLPQDLIRFEYHMGQPVRIHNVYKSRAGTEQRQGHPELRSHRKARPPPHLRGGTVHDSLRRHFVFLHADFFGLVS
jgi:hypothetical protein